MLLDWKSLACLNDADLGLHDIAAVNLACAVGLPGGPTEAQAAECLDRLDHYARAVADYTARRQCDFEARPGYYDRSEGKFRVVMMVSVLQKLFGVRYNTSKIAEGSTHTAAEAFVHGPLVGEGGTCSSMPAVYLAVGRRLGYPLKLVAALQHLFFRWDGRGERFNVEATSDRIDAPPDDHYRRGRFQIDFDQEVYYRFLAPLTPREELACFLVQRGYMWAFAGDYKQALEAIAWCCRAAGTRNRSYEWILVGFLEKLRERIEAARPPNFPAMKVQWPPRRHPWLPEYIERRMVFCEVNEQVLEAPQHQAWWEALRRSPHDRPKHVPVGMELCVTA